MKRRYIYWGGTVLAVAAVVFGVYQQKKINAMAITVENNYNRAFHELVDYVDDIDTLLEKSMLVSSPAKMAAISSEIFRQVSAAKGCLSQLPISEVLLENTEKFLSQVGDYTFYLSQNVINNKAVTEGEYKNLSSLSDYASTLNGLLMSMQEEVYNGNLTFSAAEKVSKQYLSTVAEAKGAISDFEGVENEFTDYPALIYDGPFSEHMERLEPIMTDNKEKVTVEDALEAAREFLGDRGRNLFSNGESDNNMLPSYSFAAVGEDGREINIAITKTGGLPVYFTDTRIVYEENLTEAQAAVKARDFLYQRGFDSLSESYYERDNGTVTVNFAYTQGGVVCYSDLIKVKVALDNGEVLGVEMHGYLMNHRYRDFPEIKLTADEARAKINSHLNVTAAGMALIPKEGIGERLCYEFKGNHRGRNFIIYINAESGAEEEIMMLLESENGTLAI